MDYQSGIIVESLLGPVCIWIKFSVGLSLLQTNQYDIISNTTLERRKHGSLWSNYRCFHWWRAFGFPWKKENHLAIRYFDHTGTSDIILGENCVYDLHRKSDSGFRHGYLDDVKLGVPLRIVTDSS